MGRKKLTEGDKAKARILQYLQENQTYQNSDDELVNLYAETYEFYHRTKLEMADSDLLMAYTNKAGAENLVKNPLLSELTKTAQLLNNLLKSLGLTPAQRKQAMGGEGGEEDDFDSY